MKEQIKFVLALGAVLLLLPCVLTVFLSGRGAVSFFGEEDLEGYVAAGTCLALPFSGTEEMRKAQAAGSEASSVRRRRRSGRRG